MLAAIERHAASGAIGLIAAGLSLLLGPAGRARQQSDAAEIRRSGATPLIVGLKVLHSDDVEAMISTVAGAAGAALIKEQLPRRRA